jgi:hypothetical protein
MSNQPLLPDDGDFTALPPSPAPIDEGIQREEPEQPAQLPTSLVAEPPPLDFRRKPTLWERSRPWLLAVLILPAMALGSWRAGGTDVWAFGTALCVLSLIILGLVALRHLGTLTRRSYITYGYLMICCGTWFGIGYYWPLTTIQVNGGLDHSMERGPTTPLRVRYDGQTMVELERCQVCAFSFRGRFEPKLLQIESLGPQGWIRRPFDDYSDRVSLKDIPVTWIYVDNRKNGSTVLACGEVSFDIPAEGKEIYRVPGLEVIKGYPVLLDGQQVGFLTDKNILIDTRGKRSYTERTVIYGGPLEIMMNKPEIDPGSSSFRKKRLHQLDDKIDYFLEPAPKEIKVQAFGGIAIGTEKRTELLEDDDP